MKYIIFQTGGHRTYPVLFPGNIKHSMIAKQIGEEVHSAGFCEHDTCGWHCFGESQSLSAKCVDGDSEFVDVWMSV